MVGVTIIANTKEVEAWLLDIQRRVVPNTMRLSSREIAKRIQTRAKNNITERARWQRSGQLQNSIKVRPNKSGKKTVSYTVEATSPHAAAVEYGTKPHVIPMPIGSKGDRLARYWRGNTVRGNSSRAFTQSEAFHLHPGTRPMKFMQGAYNEVLNDVGEIMQRNFYKELR